MKIIPISFVIAFSELTEQTSEAVEKTIKDTVLEHIIEEITPMLDDENFIEMIPSEDGSEFTININVMLGSTNQYIDATAEVTTRLKSYGVNDKHVIDSTRPLIDLVK